MIFGVVSSIKILLLYVILINAFFTEIYYEKQRYDGWFNNRAYPDWGSVGKFFIL